MFQLSAAECRALMTVIQIKCSLPGEKIFLKIKTTAPGDNPALFCSITLPGRGSEQHDTGLAALLHGLVIPDGGLHLADVRLAEHEHRHARLAYAAAYRQRQLAV